MRVPREVIEVLSSDSEDLDVTIMSDREPLTPPNEINFSMTRRA